MPSPDTAAAVVLRPPARRPAAPGTRLTERRVKAMASWITVQAEIADKSERHAMDEALRYFTRVEADCSRFLAESALSRLNSAPGRWHRCPRPLYTLLRRAAEAHRETGGLFDPRMHDRLVALGYDRSFPEVAAHGPAPGPYPEAPGSPLPRWAPRFLPGLRLAHVGGWRIDLGGIGKSFALAGAAGTLRSRLDSFLIDAGGDLYAAGCAAPNQGWRIGVEDPTLVGSAEGETPGESAPASPGPVAVLEVEDRAVTTSSVRLRHWRVGSRDVHHLLDPRTGEPGGNGLASVTVVHPDPVVAETWGKVLFLAGPGGIASEAAGRGLAALWIDRFGTMECSSEMEQYVIWRKQ